MQLPLLFGTILDELQVHGPRTLADLTDPVATAINKPERLSMIYPDSADRWGDFVLDGLEQMETRGIVERDGEQWRLGPKFKAGERMVVIQARKGKTSQVGIMVYPPGETANREADEIRKLELTSIYARLRRDGPSLRPPDEKHVKRWSRALNSSAGTRTSRC